MVERDYSILLDLLRLRFATTEQLCALHFPGTGGRVGRMKACQRRLKKLVDERLIKPLRIPGVGTHPFIYVLTPRGLERLSAEIGIDPSDVSLTNLALDEYHVPEKGFDNHEHLKHILACNDFFLALSRACQQIDGLELQEYIHEYELRTLNFIGKVEIPGPADNRKTRHYTLVPDAFFRLQRGTQELQAFLEMDRSTIPVKRKPTHWELSSMTKKFQGYAAYFSSPHYQSRLGGHTIVLVVTKTPERLESLYTALRSTLGDDERVWFATLSHATDPQRVLTAIWQIADEELSERANGERRRFSLLGG